MQTRTIRYAPMLNAMVLLEEHVVGEWEAVENRGHKNKTHDGTVLTLFPESYQIKVYGTKNKVASWERIVAQSVGPGRAPPRPDSYLDPEILDETRGYIESIGGQVNRCYGADAFDAVSVLTRRLVETLIIECFEKHGLAATVKDGAGNYKQLSDLITSALHVSQTAGGAWTISRNGKDALGKIKAHGDLSAHSRTYLAKRSDVDGIKLSVRVCAEELLTIAGLK